MGSFVWAEQNFTVLVWLLWYSKVLMRVFLRVYIWFHAYGLVVFQRHLSSVAASLAHDFLIIFHVCDITSNIVDSMVQPTELDPLWMQILHLLLLLLFKLNLAFFLNLIYCAPLCTILHHYLWKVDSLLLPPTPANFCSDRSCLASDLLLVGRLERIFLSLDRVLEVTVHWGEVVTVDWDHGATCIQAASRA